MVGQLVVMGNPKKKKRKVRRMSALQRKYFGKRRGKKASTKKRRRRARGETVIVATSNPRRKRAVSKRRKVRRRKSARRVIRARSNPRRSHRRRRVIRSRRNPRVMSGSIGGFLSNSLVPAAIGAGGALALDWTLNNVTLPASLNTQGAQPAIRIAGSLLIGMGVGMVAGNEAGEQAAAGGLIVTLYQWALQTLNKNGQGNNRNGMNRYVAMRGFGNRRLGAIRRRRRLAALPPAQRMAAIRAMRRNARMGNGMPLRMKVGVPRLGAGSHGRFRLPRRAGLGYIGPAKTMGRYLNNGR